MNVKMAKMQIPVCKEFMKILFHESWKSFRVFHKSLTIARAINHMMALLSKGVLEKIHRIKNFSFIHFVVFSQDFSVRWIVDVLNAKGLKYCTFLILIYFDQSTWFRPIGLISIDPFRSIILTNCTTLELDKVNPF